MSVSALANIFSMIDIPDEQLIQVGGKFQMAANLSYITQCVLFTCLKKLSYELNVSLKIILLKKYNFLDCSKKQNGLQY